MAPLIVVSGGSRAVPDGSDSPTEADAIADVLLNLGVPKEAIALERLASNTSENFWLSAELLRDLGLDPASFLAVTKPYAERRTIATARRRWPPKQVSVTSEVVTFDDYLAGGIPADRILSHLAGEALRLDAYAATGLIDPGEPVPADILEAARALQAAGFSSRTINGAGNFPLQRSFRLLRGPPRNRSPTDPARALEQRDGVVAQVQCFPVAADLGQGRCLPANRRIDVRVARAHLTVEPQRRVIGERDGRSQNVRSSSLVCCGRERHRTLELVALRVRPEVVVLEAADDDPWRYADSVGEVLHVTERLEAA